MKQQKGQFLRWKRLVDIVELDSFSDPAAEGPVIECKERALAGGTTPRGVFEMVSRF